MSGWERLSAVSGGTVAAFASDDRARLFAATMAGVFQSLDLGCTWNPTSPDRNVPFCEVIATSGSALYAGCRTGLYRSDDGGLTWRHLLAGGRVLSLASNGDLLLVGTEQDGVLRSEDGGRSFVSANAGLTDTATLAIALSPAFERDGTAFAGTPSGVFRTRNRGKSWRSLEIDTPVQCLWLSPHFAQDQLVLAGTESDGLFRSDDAGAHWEPIRELAGHGVSALASSSNGAVAAATDGGVAISEDLASWRTKTVAHGPVLALTFTGSADTELLLLGLQRSGIMRASKPFTDWARCTLHAQLLLSIAFSSSFASDQTMFAAGPDVGVIRSVDGGRTWTASPIGPDEGPRFSIAVAPNGWVFSDSQTGVWRSRDNGATWEPVGEPVPAATVIAGPQRTDGSWLLLVVSMSGDLLMSSDRGASWHVVSGHFGAGVVAATVAADGTLFVTTRKDEDLALWRSVDDGATWQRYLVERSRAMCALAVSPEYAVDQRVYVGLGSRILTPIPHTREVRSREQRPLWRGVDLGAEVSALATPPGSSHGHLVYAATNSGLFVSRDGGEHFGGPRIDADAPSAITGMALSPNYTQDRLAYALQVGGMVWRRAC